MKLTASCGLTTFHNQFLTIMRSWSLLLSKHILYIRELKKLNNFYILDCSSTDPPSYEQCSRMEHHSKQHASRHFGMQALSILWMLSLSAGVSGLWLSVMTTAFTGVRYMDFCFLPNNIVESHTLAKIIHSFLNKHVDTVVPEVLALLHTWIASRMLRKKEH